MDYPALTNPFSPEQQAQAARLAAAFASRNQPQALVAAPPPPQPDNGVLTDIGHGLYRGALVEAPRMLGEAAQAFTGGSSGQGLVDFAAAHENDPTARVTGAWGQGASYLPTIGGLVGASALAAAAAPEAIATGVGVGANALLGGALFGGSTYTEAKNKGVSTGGALGEAAIQGVGQGVLGYGAGRVLGAFGGTLAKRAGAQGVLDSFTNPSTYGRLAKSAALNAGVQVPVQGAAAAGMGAIDNAEDIPNTPSSWEAAKASVGPTLAMSALLAPFGLPAIMMDNRTRRRMGDTVAQPPPPDAPKDVRDQFTNERLRHLVDIKREMAQVSPDAAQTWAEQALAAINDEAPVQFDANWTYEPGQPQSSPVPPQLALPYVPQMGQGEPPAVARNPRVPNADQHAEALQAARDAEEARRNFFMSDPGTQLGMPGIERGGATTPEEGRPDFALEPPSPQMPLDLQPRAPETAAAPGQAPLLFRDRSSVNDARTADEVGARLQQAKQESAPGQGTALALGLADGRAIVVPDSNGRASFNVTKQDRVKWLREGLGSAPPKMLNELAGLEPHQLADVLQNVWHEKGGENAAQAYIPRVEALYRQLTGQDIRATEGVTEGTRRHFELTPPGAEAAAPKGTGESFTTPEQRAAALRQEAAVKGQVTKRQGDLFSEPKPLTKEQQKRQDSVTKTLSEHINEVADTTASKATEGAKPEPAAGEARAKDAASAEQVHEGQGDANPERNAGQDEEAARLVKTLPLGVDALASSKALTPVVRVNGKLYDGPVHGVALKRALEDPASPKTKEGKLQFNRKRGDSADLFRTPEGELIDRAEAAKRAGAEEFKSETNTDGGQQYKAENPVPPARTEAPKRTEAQVKAARAEAQRTAGTEAAEQRVTEVGAQLKAARAEGNAAEVARLEKAHDDAVGRAERVAQGAEHEPLVDLPKYDEKKSLTDNAADIHNFVLLHKVAGATTKAMRDAWALMHPEKRGDAPTGADLAAYRDRRSKVAAALAISHIPAGEYTKLERGMEQWSARLRAKAKALEAIQAGLTAARDEAADTIETAHQAKQLDAIMQSHAEGRLSTQQALQKVTQLSEEAKTRRDSRRREIAALDNQPLGARVKANPVAHAAMEHIARTHPNPIVRAVAKALARHKPNSRVEVLEDAAFDGGRYVTANDSIQIGSGGMNPITLMHETTHALAHKAIGQAVADQHTTEALSPRRATQVSALREVQKVMEAFRAKADLTRADHRLALEDEQEFVAEALNNPDIQEALGARGGLLARTMNAIRRMLGIDQKFHGQFADLMHAATDLFGDPRRDGLEVYQRAIREIAGQDPKSPQGIFNSVANTIEKLSHPGARMREGMLERDLPAKLHAEALQWQTLNNLHWLADRTLARAGAARPELKPKFDAFGSVFKQWKVAVDERKSQFQHVLNAKGESQEIQRRVLSAEIGKPDEFGRMTQMARDSRISGVVASAKTLAEAQRYNKDITAAEFNSSGATKARNTFAKLSPEMQQLYGDILQKHRLDFARYYATTMGNVIRLAGQHGALGEKYDALDWTRYGRDYLPADQQETKLRTAIRDAHDGVTQMVKGAQLKGENDEAFKDATALSEAVDGLVNTYHSQRQIPYVHLGRSGEYHIGFKVKDDPNAWQRVGAVVGADRDKGGLNRDWRDQLPSRADPEQMQRKVYMRFGSAAELNEAKARLKSLKEQGLLEEYFDGRAIEHSREMDAASPGFMKALERYVTRAYDPESAREMLRDIQQVYRQQLPETSPLKAHIMGDAVPGSSKDFVNTFADRMAMSNNALVNAWSQPRIAEALSGLTEQMRALSGEEFGNDKLKLGAYVNELRGRAQDMRRPVNSPVIDQARGLTALWRLAISPAYVAMTMFQPWQMTLPFVGAKFGYRNTMLGMGRNFKFSLGLLNSLMKQQLGSEAGGPIDKLASISQLQLHFRDLKKADGSSLLSGDQLRMLEDLQWSGLLNFGQTQQIFRVDPSKTGPMAKAINIGTIMSHYAEMSNRLTGALTGFEMAVKGGMKYEDARDYAIQTIRNTDGDHTQANVARKLGRRGIAGAMTPLFVGFGQYDIQMSEQLYRAASTALGKGKDAQEARKALLGVAGMTTLMAGALGIPGVGLFSAIANGVRWAIGSPNDDPPDTEKDLRDGINSAIGGMFGAKAAEVVARGIPRAADFDMSARSGYQDLLPFTEFLKDRRKWDDQMKDEGFQMLGPAVGALSGIITGSRALYEGDWVKFNNDALPAFARNIAKATRLSQYGYETQGGNNQLPVPVNSWNVIAQGLGFNSSGKAEQAEKAFQLSTNQQLLQQRHQVLRNAAYRAFEHGDYDRLGSVLQQNIDFTMQHPFFGADIGSGLKERAVERTLGGISGTGVLASKHVYPQMQSFFNQGGQ